MEEASKKDPLAKDREINPDKFNTSLLVSEINSIKASFDIRDNSIVKLHKPNVLSASGGDSLNKSVVESIAKNVEKDDLSAFIATEILNRPDYFRLISMEDYRAVIYANAKLGQWENAQKAFDLMIADDVKPNTKVMNALLDAYANASRMTDTLKLFHSYKNYDLQHDSVSFGIVIKLMTRQKRLTEAFRLYEEMKKLNVPVTQPIFSTLISGCTKVGDYNRAWKLFEHMSTREHKPDQITFNNMIYICSRTHNVEKAFHLFDQMKAQNLQPLDSTFNSLIQACSKRADYYRQTFSLVAEMEELGFKPDLRTYNFMLDACALQCDIVRAKALLSEMETKTVATYASLARCYSRVPLFLQKLNEWCEWEKRMDKLTLAKFESRIGLDNVERVDKGLKPIDVTDWVLDDRYDPDEQYSISEAFGKSFEELKNYYLINKSFQKTFDVYRKEGLEVCQRFIPSLGRSDSDLPVMKHDLELTGYLMNSLLTLLASFGYEKLMQNVFEKQYTEHRLEKDSYTYLAAISGLVNPIIPGKKDDLNALMKALEYLNEYEKYRAEKNYPKDWLELETKYLRNKYNERGITHLMKIHEYKIYATVIKALARNDELHRAVALLKMMVDRGHAKTIVNTNVYNPALDNTGEPEYYKPKPMLKLSDFKELEDKVKMSAQRELEREFDECISQAKIDYKRGIERNYVKQIK